MTDLSDDELSEIQDDLEYKEFTPSPDEFVRKFLYYSKFTQDELSKQFPEIEAVLGDPSREELLQYAIEGRINSHDDLTRKIKRWNEYNDLSEVGKSLMDLIHKNQDGYIEGIEHPMERYIIAYDQNLDSEPVLRSIGDVLNIPLYEDFDIDLYEGLTRVIKNS